MKSRYQNLHRVGTLSLGLAWIALVLGILGAIGIWLGLNQVSDSLSANFEMPSGLGPAPFLAALPGLFIAVLVFLQFYIIGKVLHLLVDLEARSTPSQQTTPAAAAPVASSDSEISGELNRQAKLIASNLEATQGVQQQLASLQARMSGVALPAVVAPTGVSTAESTQTAS